MTNQTMTKRNGRSLTDEELMEILEVRIPALLQRRPELEKRIYFAWVDVFAKRSEVAAIMEELRRIADAQDDFRQETRLNFERVDQHLQHLDTQVDNTGQRLDKMDQRFDQIDQRFEQVDQRFGQVDEQFVEIRKQFERVDQRFDHIENKIETQGQQLRDWMTLNLGRFQVKMGRSYEDFVASALRFGLGRSDILPQYIKLRQIIVDHDGLIFRPGRTKEVDIIMKNGEWLVFEVKAAAKFDDVDEFADKVELLQQQNPDKKVSGILITLAPEAKTIQRCRERGIDLPPQPVSEE